MFYFRNKTMDILERLTLLHRVASMYHVDKLKKYEIAAKIKQSPTQVGLLLKEAKEKGIIKIDVVLPRFSALRLHLIERLGLLDAVVVPTEKETHEVLLNLSLSAAEYFEENVREGARVAVGGGYLIFRMVEKIPYRDRDIDIYPTALIGRGPSVEHVDPTFMVSLLWAKSGQEEGRGHYMTLTPPSPDASENQIRKHYKLLNENTSVKELIDDMRAVDFVFASVGALKPRKAYINEAKTLSRSFFFHELGLDHDNLIETGVIGDMAYCFFDRNGQDINDWSIFPSIGLEGFRDLSANPEKRVILVVGSYKMDALKAAIAGRLCNVLITDSAGAEELLRIK